MSHAYGTAEWDEAYARYVSARISDQAKPYIMGTPEWVDGFKTAVQNEPTYKEVAKNWEYSIVMHFLARPDLGVTDDFYLFMDLWHGECRNMRLVPRDAGESGDFVISGDYDQWKAVLKSELEPISGIVQGKLKLKGDLPVIVREVKHAALLVQLVGTVPTIFHDQLSGDQQSEYKQTAQTLRSEFGI